MEDILYWLLAHGDKFLMWALVAVGGLAAKFILSHLSAGKVRDILTRAFHEVGDAVLAVAQTYVNDIKAASEDGTLTDQEKREAKAKALALVKQNLGPAGLKKLAAIVGVDLDGWLGTKIEAAVAYLANKTKTLTVGETLTAGDVSKTVTATSTTPAVPR